MSKEQIDNQKTYAIEKSMLEAMGISLGNVITELYMFLTILTITNTSIRKAVTNRITGWSDQKEASTALVSSSRNP